MSSARRRRALRGRFGTGGIPPISGTGTVERSGAVREWRLAEGCSQREVCSLRNHSRRHERGALLGGAWRRSRSASESPEPPLWPKPAAHHRAPVGIAADADLSIGSAGIRLHQRGNPLAPCSGATGGGPCWVSVSQLTARHGIRARSTEFRRVALHRASAYRSTSQNLIAQLTFQCIRHAGGFKTPEVLPRALTSPCPRELLSEAGAGAGPRSPRRARPASCGGQRRMRRLQLFGVESIGSRRCR